MEDTIIITWLESVKNLKTRENYSIAMTTFQEFAGLRGEEFLAEIDAEEAKPLTQRGSIEKRFVPFFEWFTAKGNAEGTAVAKLGAVMGFYRYYNYRCNFKLSKFKATKKNRVVNLTKADVRKLVSAAKNLRDRAIILVLYQSGMDLSTLRSLKVRDVKQGLESGELPLRLNLRRRKEAVEYHSFLATDAIEAVRAYLNERLRKEGALDPASPLFIKERFVTEWKGKKREVIVGVANNLIEKCFREIAVEAGLITQEEVHATKWNPYRPHSLRRAFGDALRASGADYGAVEYFIGHKTPMGGAYLGNIDQAYIKAMDSLSIFGSSNEVTNLKIQAVEEQLRTSKEASFKQEEELISLRRQMEGIQELLSFVEPFIKDHLEWTAPSKGFSAKEKQVILARQGKRVVS
jgi:integrase/recombinase XerD